MSKRGWLCWGVLALLVACGGSGGTGALDGGANDGGVGDGGSTDGGPDATPLSFVTSTLPAAVAGGDYSANLQIQGGAAPFTWSLTNASSNLAWLQIDHALGALTGTAGSGTGDGTFTAHVSDSAGQTAASAFHLTVNACADGAISPCSVPSNQACFEGTRTCSGGAYGTCQSDGVPSTDINNCGSNCGACGLSGDRCEGGQCACGDGGTACTAGTSPACCGGGCDDLYRDLNHCGTCDTDCAAIPPPSGSAPSCAGGACAFSCLSGRANCDSPDGGTTVPNDGNGCETVLAKDVNNCGACGNACPVGSEAASAFCDAGTCGVVCQPNFGNCDDDVSTGCEANLKNGDPDHCNSCDVTCPLEPHEVTRACTNGVCTVGTCAAGWLDCQNGAADGCETAIGVNNCGTCGHVCPGTTNGYATCNSNQCGLACNAGYQLCGGVCVSDYDSRNCGACGNVCDPDLQVCASKNGSPIECCEYDCTTLPCRTICLP